MHRTRLLTPGIMALAMLAWCVAPASAAFRDRHFHSPSGNIRCSFSTPPAAVMCLSRNNNRVAAVSRYGAAFRTTNSGGFSPGRTLGYGRRWKRSSLVCICRHAGMTCYSRITTFGFTISRSGITLF